MPSRKVFSGPKGGQFYLSDDGKKVYVKQQDLKTKPIKKQSSPRKQNLKKQSKTSKWNNIEPKTKSNRKSILDKCGNVCFLEPDTLGFPVCGTNSCNPTCSGIEAAYKRAREYHHDSIANKALGLKKKHNC
jgi:hypothetical protein